MTYSASHNKDIWVAIWTMQSDGTVLHVLKAESIRDNSTYDGVDWGGERVAKEVCFVKIHVENKS